MMPLRPLISCGGMAGMATTPPLAASCWVMPAANALPCCTMLSDSDAPADASCTMDRTLPHFCARQRRAALAKIAELSRQLAMHLALGVGQVGLDHEERCQHAEEAHHSIARAVPLPVLDQGRQKQRSQLQQDHPPLILRGAQPASVNA